MFTSAKVERMIPLKALKKSAIMVVIVIVAIIAADWFIKPIAGPLVGKGDA